MPRKRPGWALYPSYHEAVQEKLDENGLTWHFHDKDETACDNSWETFVVGRFVCDNKSCSAVGWGSKKIAVTIRQYQHRQYNVRVYYQRCKVCDRRAVPILDDDIFVERVLYWLKKWSNVYVERPEVSENKGPPHRSDLCEGCIAGHCKEGSYYSDLDHLRFSFSNL